MANQENCQKVVDYLLAHPENHDQNSWLQVTSRPEINLCGTTLCIAGAAALLCGDLDLVQLPGSRRYTATIEGVPLNEYMEDNETDEDSYFERVGAEILGLDSWDAHHLFGDMDEDRALRKLKEYANG